jgi:MFS family permease
MLFFAGFNMLIPELPAYLTKLGGAEYKGLIISLFTVTAMISRPFSGKLADKIGRVPVMIFGALVCLVCSFIYPILSSLYGFFLLRFVHGFSTGFTPTGHATYLSDIVPANRRGEAMGFLGTAGAIGMAGGPAIGGMITFYFGLNALFYVSAGCAMASVIIMMNVQETLKQRARFSLSMLKLKGEDVFEPRVLAPCIVMVLSVYAYGTVYTLIPDFGEHVGMTNKGLLFTYITVASLLVRLLAGKASDHYGRIPVLRVSTFVIFISTIVIGMATTQWTLIIGVALYGIGHGINSPALLAWASDLSDEQHKGRGFTSLYIFMELGIGLGAFSSGWLYANQPANFFFTFTISSALALVAFGFMVVKPLLAKT